MHATIQAPLRVVTIGEDGVVAVAVCVALREADSSQVFVEHRDYAPNRGEEWGKVVADVVVLCGTLTDDRVDELLAAFRHRPVVFAAETMEQERALELIHRGAQDCVVMEQVKGGQLLRILRYAVERHHLAANGANGRLGSGSTQVIDLTSIRQHDRIGRYEVERCLGMGSMGTVYLVTRLEDPSNAKYALKIMSTTVPPGRFEIERERFLREAHAAATLDHPNVVKVHETGYLDKGRHPFSVMEYVEGQNLAKRFDEVFRLELRERARLVKEMADGLGAIHARFLCHRDMKPQNILITTDYHAKIADLGLVRYEGSNITLDTSLVGTPAFMAPEGFSSPHTDGRADIFSLGIIAYILFVGRRPFTGESIDDMAEAIIHGLPVDPLEDDPAFPLNLREILGRMLDKRPEHRFQNCGDLSSALAAYLEHGPTRSRLLQHLRLRRVWR